MGDHEIELISALVEGRLEDETEARALIESSPELQVEYEAQMQAYEALSSAGRAVMRDHERSALHRDVWTALRATEPAPRPATTPWYYRWVPVGAGIVVVTIGAATILSGGSVSDSAEVLQEAAADTTITSASATTEAATEMAADTAEEDGATDLTQGEAAAAVPETGAFSAAARSLRDKGADGTLEAPAVDESAIDLDGCLDNAGLEDVDVVRIIDSVFLTEALGIAAPATEESRQYIVAVPAQADLETALIYFVDVETCEIVFEDE